MLMALPNLDGSFTMTLYNPAEGEMSLSSLSDKEKIKKHFESEYPDSIELMPNYINEISENPVGKLGTVRMGKWFYQDKIVLLGDAAHSIVPFFGQGMNCGFEDVYYLMKFYNESKSWENTFIEYDNFQRPNGNAIAEMAVDNFIEMKDRVGDPRFILRKKVEHKIEEEFSATYRARYGMVTYTLIPYQLCLEAGKIQNDILESLCADLSTLEELDLVKAKTLIEEKFVPFLQRNDLILLRYNHH